MMTRPWKPFATRLRTPAPTDVRRFDLSDTAFGIRLDAMTHLIRPENSQYELDVDIWQSSEQKTMIRRSLPGVRVRFTVDSHIDHVIQQAKKVDYKIIRNRARDELVYENIDEDGDLTVYYSRKPLAEEFANWLAAANKPPAGKTWLVKVHARCDFDNNIFARMRRVYLWDKG
jgi:hypothetical protein